MANPIKLNFKMYQGSTFKEVLRWESTTKVYVPITGITKAAPAVITATGHGVPVGWRVKITGVSGMKEINDADNYQLVTAVTDNTLTINDINASGYTAYTSGGILEYYQPVELSGYTARMQIREKLDSNTVLAELTTQNGGIVINSSGKYITLNLSAVDTAALNFNTAVYSLEMVKSGEVTTIVTGTISFNKEVTR